MTYTAIPTKSPGDLITSALWNIIAGDADSGFCRMIADSTLGVAASSVDFTGLSQTFAHLLVVCYARTSSATASGDLILAQFNGDTAANYDYDSPGSSPVAAATGMGVGFAAGGASAANIFAASLFIVPMYAAATNRKTMIGISGVGYTNGASFLGGSVAIGNWRTNATAINRLTFLPASGNFAAATRVTVYGLPA